jgi:hypothetical protein
MDIDTDMDMMDTSYRIMDYRLSEKNFVKAIRLLENLLSGQPIGITRDYSSEYPIKNWNYQTVKWWIQKELSFAQLCSTVLYIKVHMVQCYHKFVENPKKTTYID